MAAFFLRAWMACAAGHSAATPEVVAGDVGKGATKLVGGTATVLDGRDDLRHAAAMKRCPDCETGLSAIQIVDQKGHGLTDVGFHFTRSSPPKTSSWSGKLTNSAGRVQAFLCDACGRVLLYAGPNEAPVR
jgi:hypothetical protein